MENATISPMADVRTFFYFLMVEMDLGGSFHPDIPICDYVNAESGKDTFDPDKANVLQDRLTECFVVCSTLGADIYKTGLRMAQRLGFSPRPDDSAAIEQAIKEVNAHITRDKHIIFRDTPFPKGHLTSVEKPHCYLMECGNFVEVYIKKP
mgnify:CR=1 FL=1